LPCLQRWDWADGGLVCWLLVTGGGSLGPGYVEELKVLGLEAWLKQQCVCLVSVKP
jgi:hypothetical protein